MKKSIAAILCVVLAFLLLACADSTDYSGYVAGKTFVYENDGFYGDFRIEVNQDGTFLYYEGLASSYLGIGEWTVEGNTLTLKDELFTNLFEIEEGKLRWKEKGSDNFTYMKVKDGEAFNEE